MNPSHRPLDPDKTAIHAIDDCGKKRKAAEVCSAAYQFSI
jgi:hypothetical protein